MNASPRIRLYFDIFSNKILKRDLPERTGPFVNYIRVIITLRRLPARRLTKAEYQYITVNLGNIWETL